MLNKSWFVFPWSLEYAQVTLGVEEEAELVV